MNNEEHEKRMRELDDRAKKANAKAAKHFAEAARNNNLALLFIGIALAINLTLLFIKALS